jgi:hypothetical protein
MSHEVNVMVAELFRDGRPGAEIHDDDARVSLVGMMPQAFPVICRCQDHHTTKRTVRLLTCATIPRQQAGSEPRLGPSGSPFR